MLPKVKMLKPYGMLDRTMGNEFRQKVNELVKQGLNIISIDLTRVTFMDSSGLGCLVLILKTVNDSGGRLFLICPNEQIKILFKLTNMDELFEIVENQEELPQKLAQ